MFDDLLNFYNMCLKLGCVRILKDFKSNGALAMYAPSKDGMTHSSLWIPQTDLTFFIKKVHANCWISIILSYFNVKKMMKFIKSVENKDNLKYSFTWTGKLKILSEENGKSIKIKLFSINY